MKQQLVPCPSCARHVRVNEVRCPFCALSLEALSPRWAALAVGVTLALSGCAASRETVETTVKPVTPTSQGAVVAPVTQPTSQPERVDVPAYGLSPIEAAPERPRPKYGAPPPPDEP